MTLNLSRGMGDTTTGLDTVGGISTVPTIIGTDTTCDPTDPLGNCYNDLTVVSPSIPCMPVGGVGPLQPGQVYCATGTGVAATQPAATSMNWVILAAVLGGLILISGKH